MRLSEKCARFLTVPDEEAPLRTRSDQRSQKRAALSAEAETCLGEKPRRHDVRSRKPPIVPKRTSPISEATTTERGHVRESISSTTSRTCPHGDEEKKPSGRHLSVSTGSVASKKIE